MQKKYKVISPCGNEGVLDPEEIIDLSNVVSEGNKEVSALTPAINRLRFNGYSVAAIMEDGGAINKYSDAIRWWGNDLSLNEQKEYAKKHLKTYEYSELFGSTSQYSNGERRKMFIEKIWEGENKPQSKIKGLYEDGGAIEGDLLPFVKKSKSMCGCSMKK